MSFLAIDEIRGKTSGTPTDVNNLKYQLATAWVNFNGTGTVTIRDSFNVSSITDNGVGKYAVNFAAAMDNADYSGCLTPSADGAVSTTYIDPPLSNSSLALTTASTSAAKDSSVVFVSIFGGKT